MPVATKRIVDPEIRAIIEKDYIGTIDDDFLLFGDEETCLRNHFQKQEERINNLELRNDDIIVASFPKSGTTWVQEMVWLIKNRMNLTGSEVSLPERFPMLEVCAVMKCRSVIKEEFYMDSVKYVDQLKGQRYIKTHLPFCLLPKDLKNGIKQPKVIYVMRNPKDVFISYFYHVQCMHGWAPSKEDFAKVFLADKVLFAPYWKNVLGFHNVRHWPNILIIKYEDMKDDIKQVIEKVCKFLDEDPLTTDQMELLCERLDFNFMKNNNAVNYKRNTDLSRTKIPNVKEFMRSGTVGNYREEMSEEMIAQFDEWIKRNISSTDFNQTYAYGYYGQN